MFCLHLGKKETLQVLLQKKFNNCFKNNCVFISDCSFEYWENIAQLWFFRIVIFKINGPRNNQVWRKWSILKQPYIDIQQLAYWLF